MPSPILMPPKVYLDTNHLIHIDKLRAGKAVPQKCRAAYELIDELIRKHQIGLVFNFMSPIEWLDGNATLDTARQLAAVVDSAKLQYYFEGDEFFLTAELVAECRRIDATLNLPLLEILQVRNDSGRIRTTPGTLCKAIPGFYEGRPIPQYLTGIEPPAEIAVYSVGKYVEGAYNFRQANPESVVDRVAGFNSTLIDDMTKAIPRLRDKDLVSISDIPRWLKRYLRIDKILSAMNPDCNIDDIVGRIEIERCPGLALWFKVREHRIRANYAPKDNDIDDWIFIPAMPYVDLTLTEKNLRDLVHRADSRLKASVVSNPNDAADFLRDWFRS